jgi:hypothetical protein
MTNHHFSRNNFLKQEAVMSLHPGWERHRPLNKVSPIFFIRGIGGAKASDRLRNRCWLAGRFGFGFLIGTSTKEPFDERRPAFVVVTFCCLRLKN